MSNPIQVKICGITNPDDAVGAVALGADALGFVFHKGSPRFIEPSEAKRIIRRLPPFVTTVGVFVDTPSDRIRSVYEDCGLALIQFHGSEPPEALHPFASRAIKAVRVKGRSDFDVLPRYSVATYLLDSYVEGVPGGSGRPFDWTWAREARRYGKVILAGGLTPENVRSAILAAEPDGVDVSSGVEERPGKKDLSKVRRFIEAAKTRIRDG